MGIFKRLRKQVAVLLLLLFFTNMVQAADGYTWNTYDTSNGLADNTVTSVCVSGENIYAATYGGLSVYNGSSWTTYTTADGLANNIVFSVCVSGGNIYAATAGGVSVYNKSSWTTYTTADGLANNTARDVYVSDGNIYVATNGGGLSVYNGSTWTTYTTTDGLANNTACGVYVSDGNIYVATNGGGLSVFNGSSWTTYTTADGLASNNLYDVYVSDGNIYVATNGGGLSVYSGSSWTTYTTSDGLGNNNVKGIYVIGGNIYAATAGGVSVYNGSSWTTYTTADGLASNYQYGVYVSNGNIYAATSGGLSVATPKGDSGSSSSSLSYSFNSDGGIVTYTALKSGTAFASIKMNEANMGVGTLADTNFSDVVMNITAAGKPSLTIPESNSIAATVNTDLTDTALVTASFTGLPKQSNGKVPPIIMNGVQISDSKGQVFSGIEPISGLPYTSFVRNISWDNSAGTMTFEILHFTEYGVPVLIGKTFAGTAATTPLNANGTNIVVSYSGGSITGTVTQNSTVTVQKISGLAYETVLSDVPGTANNLYRPMVPGVTYNISFEYINRGNASDQVDLTTAITRTNDEHFTVGGNESKSVAAWQVASFNIEIDADNAYAYERATVDITIDLNGVNAVSYNAFSDAYEGGTFAEDGQYGGVADLSHRFVLEAEGYSLTILSRSVTVNAPSGYTGTPVSETNLVPGVQITYFVAVKNNNNSVATSINLTDVIPNSCHLYYTTTPNVTGTTRWDWQGATDNAATNATSDAVKFEITIPALSTVTASYTVTLD